jgi:hypothetical protein
MANSVLRTNDFDTCSSRDLGISWTQSPPCRDEMVPRCCLYSADLIPAKPEISKELRDVQTVAFRSKNPRRVATHGRVVLVALRSCMAIYSVRRRLVERLAAACSAACVHCLHAIDPRSQ